MPLELRFALASSVALKQLVKKPNPLDEKANCLLLDLRGTESEHAESALRTITTTLSPQLYLQADKTWIVSTGPISPSDAAKIIAEQFVTLGYKNVRLAVVQGEALTDRLEELAQARADLTDDTGTSLLDYKESPLSVLTNAPAAPIAEAMSDGAQIVLTQRALPGTMALGAYAGQLVGPSLPAESAASIASAADLLAQLGQIPITTDCEAVIAHTTSQGECFLENLSEVVPTDFLADRSISNTLPEVVYQSQWKADTKDRLCLDSIKSQIASDSLDLLVTVLEKFRLEFQVKFASGLQYDKWYTRLNNLISAGIDLTTSQFTESHVPKYLLSIESTNRSSLEALAQQIELLSFASQDGPHLKGSLISSIQKVFRNFEMAISSKTAEGLVEFQHQMRTVEEWID